MSRKLIAFLATILMIATLWGCGSNRDSGGSTTGAGSALGNDPVTGVAYVGAGSCIGCHEGFSWSADDVTAYLSGKHVIHSDHINAASDPVCLQCHDPLGDGPTIENKIDPVDVPVDGLAAVTCENCHGAGGEHYGTGPIPEAKPGPDACGKCHNDKWAAIPEAAGHLDFHPEGNDILNNYQGSNHAASIHSFMLVSGTTADVKAPCSRCHTDEGGRLYQEVNTAQKLSLTVQSVANASAVQCRTCHDPHKPDSLLMTATSSASAEYNTCTNCHQGDNAAPLAEGDVGYDDTADLHDQLIYHADRYDHVITFNHADDPATANVIEGFVVDKTSDRSCRDCHNVHSADLKINEQWAASGHGGKIALVKDAADTGVNTTANTAAVKQAGVDPSNADPVLAAAAEPFAHYDWDDTNAVGGNAPFGGAAACQRCHTATGAKNYLSDPATYDPKNNDFSHLSGWAMDTINGGNLATSGQNEMLYCWGCHTNNAGGLRTPGAITADYVDAAGNAVTFPDTKDSNVCIACHAGRSNGQNIKTNFDSTKNFGSYNSHYMAAAGTLYKTTGYEYSGADYASGFFEHDQIGATDATGAEVFPGTGTHGPCAGCHMSDDPATGKANHLLTPFEIDTTTGEPIDDTPAAVCAVCHNGPYAWTPAKFADQADGFAATLSTLQAKLAAKGIYYGPGYPYFYSDAGLTIPYTGWSDQDTLGAAFNFNLLKREPGAFAHNHTYTQRMLFDSIDFLDHGSLTGTTDLAAYPNAAEWYQEDGDPSNDNTVTRP